MLAMQGWELELRPTAPTWNAEWVPIGPVLGRQEQVDPWCSRANQPNKIYELQVQWKTLSNGGGEWFWQWHLMLTSGLYTMNMHIIHHIYTRKILRSPENNYQNKRVSSQELSLYKTMSIQINLKMQLRKHCTHRNIKEYLKVTQEI